MKEYKLICPARKRPPENVEVTFGEETKMFGDSQPTKSVSFILKDMETKENLVVKAIISSRKEDLPNGDILWIQDEESYDVEPLQWYIKIIEFIEEEEGEVKVLPKMRISLGQQRGGMIKSLMDKEKQK